MEKRTLTVKEFMAKTKVSRTTITRWTRSGYLRSYRYGTDGHIRIPAEEVERLGFSVEG